MAVTATIQDSIIRQRPNGKTTFVSGLIAGPHGPGSPLFEAVAITKDDFERSFADFISAALAGEVGANLQWQEVDTAGTTAYAKQTPTNLLPSNILAAIDAVAGHGAQLHGQPMATGFLDAAFFVKGEVDVVTNLHVEIGFAETLAAASAVNISASTPTFVDTGEKAIFVVDTGYTKVEGFYTQGHAAAPAGVFVSTGHDAATGLVAASEFIIGVVLRGTDAYCFANYNVGTTSPTSTSRVGLVAVSAGGITGSQVMSPYVQFNTIGANAKNPQIDFLDFYQQRTGAPY